MTASKRITQFLDTEGVRYEIDHHDACFSAQSLASKEGTTGFRVAKTVVCFVDDQPVVLVLPAPYHVDLEIVGAELGARVVCVADPEDVAAYFPECDIEVAPPPLPLWEGIRIHADASMLGRDDIVFAAGTAKDAVRMSGPDWKRIARPSFGKFAVLTPTFTESSIIVMGVSLG